MHFRHRPPQHCTGSDHRGAALVLTLLVVALLTVVVVGFNASTRSEQMAARNYSYQVVADQMADLATEQALASLGSALTSAARTGYVTAPGAIVPMGQTEPLGLYSSNSTAVDTPPSTETEFANWITGGPLPRPGFQDVESAVGGSNQVVGRYAFFVDDETTKISLNSASAGRPAGSTNFFLRPFNISVVPPLSGAASALTTYAANTNVSTPSYFFFPRQAKALNGRASAADWNRWLPNLTTIQDTRFNLPFESAGKTGVNNLWNRTPWGAEKVAINKVSATDGGVQQVFNALNDGKLNAFFSLGGENRGFAFKYPGLLQQIAANMLMLRTRWWSVDYLRSADNFAPPSGANPPFPLGYPQQQYPVGFDVRTWPLPSGATNANRPSEAGTLKKTFGVPQSYFGAVPFPMLTEISPSVVYGWTASNRMTVRVNLALEFFNPYPKDYIANAPNSRAAVVAQIDKARFEVIQNPPSPFGRQWRGPDGTAKAVAPHNDQPDWNPGFNGVWDPWGAGDPYGLDSGVNRQLFPTGGIGVWPLPDVLARTNATMVISFDVSFDEANDTARLPGPVYCIIDCIRVLQDPDNPASVRDWVSGYDFFDALAGPNASQFEIPVDSAPGGSFVDSSPTKPLANWAVDFAAAAPLPGLSMRKSDPRMRTPLDGKTGAWIGNSSGAPLPSDFGPDTPLPGDQDFPEDPYQSCFPIVNNRFPGLLDNGRYDSAEDFGKVFTGMPWRTLSLQAQPQGELEAGARTPAIPDWVILDVFALGLPDSVPGAVAAVPVNPNALGKSALGAVVVPDRVATTLRSAAQPPLAGSVFQNIASQTWSSAFVRPPSTNTWSKVRKSFKFPDNMIALPSEIAEISGVADFSPVLTSTNETRLSSLFPLVSTTSRFFAVYARGEAVRARAGNKYETMAVSQKKTVVEALVDAQNGSVSLERLSSESGSE